MLETCRNLTTQRKFEPLDGLFSAIEAALDKRNIDPDPQKYGYFRAQTAYGFESNRPAEALAWAEKGMELALKIWPADHIMAIGARNNMAFALIHNGQYPLARPILLACLADLDRTGQVGAGFYVNINFNLGTIAQFEGDIQSALGFYTTAKEMLLAKKQFAVVAQININILSLKMIHRMDDHQIENDIFDHLGLCKKVFAPQSRDFAESLFRTGDMLLSLNFPKKAFPLLQSAAEILGTDSVSARSNLMGDVQKDLGRACQLLKKNGESLGHLLLAYSIIRNDPSKSASSEQTVRSFLIENYLELGLPQKADSLAVIFEKSLIGNPDEPEFDSYNEDFLCKYYLSKRDFVAAERHLANHKLALTRKFPGGELYFDKYFCNQFNLFSTWGKASEAEAALENWLRSLDFLADQRLFSFSEKNRFAYLDDIKIANSYLLTAKMGQPDGGRPVGEVYQKLLKYKSAAFHSGQQIESEIAGLNDPAAQKLLADWRASRDMVAHMATQSAKAVAEKGYDLNQIAENSAQLEREVVAKSAQLGILTGLQNLNWTDIQSALPPNSAAVDIYRFYFRLTPDDDFGKIRYAVFILKPGTARPEILFLENGNDLHSHLFEKYLDDIKAGKATSPEVFGAFWGKIEPFLKDARTVFVAPDGIFHRINLSTLAAPMAVFWVKCTSSASSKVWANWFFNQKKKPRPT